MESLDRGLVAVATANGVFLSWRLYGTDPAGTAFNIYRNGELVNGSPLTGATNFSDPSGGAGASYEVRALIDGRETGAGKRVTPWAGQALTVSLNRPQGGTSPDGSQYTYSPNDASVADLDGDGEYEIILKWDPSNAKDNSQSGHTGVVYIDAYTLSGQQLWRINLGRNVRAGAHYVNFMVYDFDGDGKAEMAVRTADGTVDGQGKVLGNANADYRNSDGHIITGPEYLSVFNGQTGAEMATIDYPNTRGSISDWGDAYGNRGNRFLAGVAYVDGVEPSMIFARGYYGPQSGFTRHQTKITALDWRNGRLTQRWQFHADTQGSKNTAYLGQGAHSLSVADVDGDGRDEIIYGAATIDDNGTGLYSTGLCHGDALHVGDIIPDRPGLEVFMVHESPSCYGNWGAEVHDARTGQILYGNDGTGTDVGRGAMGDILPDRPGMEVWASRGGLMDSTGASHSAKPSQMNFLTWWDGDLSRELLDGITIDKWVPGRNATERLLTGRNVESNNGTKANPALSADILGDWREEVIWRHTNNSQLVIYTTTIPTEHRLYTLMHDPQYRVAIAWQNTGYNQPPHPSFYLGSGMAEAPRPNIHLAGDPIEGTPETILRLQEDSPGFCSALQPETEHSGYTGPGYANSENAVGAGVAWAVNVPESGRYALTVRYAGTTDRPANVNVNGASAATAQFDATGAWNTWRTELIEVNLNPGNNQIALAATTADGLGNIDSLEVWHTGASAGTCQ